MKSKTASEEYVAPSASAVKFLRSLSYFARTGQRHVYAGTVPEAEIAKRRAKNRVARKQRRVNRLRGA